MNRPKLVTIYLNNSKDKGLLFLCASMAKTKGALRLSLRRVTLSICSVFDNFREILGSHDLAFRCFRCPYTPVGGQVRELLRLIR